MVAQQIKRAGNGFQRIVDLMRNDSGHPSHRGQPLGFAKGILRLQLSGNVPVDLKNGIAIGLERLAAGDGYLLAVAGNLDEVSIPFTGLRKRILYIAQSLWEPGLQN